MDLENQEITIVPTSLLKNIMEQLNKNSDVLSKLTKEKSKEEKEMKELEVKYGELALPLTKEFCKKFFNVTVETLMNRSKTNPNLTIWGKGQEKFMFPKDMKTYIESLGKNGK